MYYSNEYEVTCHEVDTNNNIKPSELVRFLQNTADHQMRDRKPTYYELFTQGKAFILTRLTVEILGPLHQYDKLEVRTWNVEPKGATFVRGYMIYNEGKIVAKASGDWAVTDVSDGHIYKASEVDISNYEKDEPPELGIPVRFRIPRDLEMENKGEHRVEYSDLDMNMHMNNTNYLNMLWDIIDEVEAKEVTSINIRFRAEAPYKSEISIESAVLPVEEAGDPRAEEVYAFRTFVDGNKNVEALIGVKSTEQSPFTVR